EPTSFFFSSRRRHTRSKRDWSSDVCSSDLRLELVNHLGVELGDDPAHILDKLQRGDWSPADVTPPPEDTMETEYSEHVREIVDSPARVDANPKFLYDACGGACKLLVFAVRTRTFPKVTGATTFYVGTNSPADLEPLSLATLSSYVVMDVCRECMGRPVFD